MCFQQSPLLSPSHRLTVLNGSLGEGREQVGERGGRRERKEEQRRKQLREKTVRNN